MVTRATLEARLAAREADLVIANATYTTLLGKINSTYTFESHADGEQSATKQKLKNIREEIQFLEAEIDKINLQLNGGSLQRLIPSRWA